MATPSARADLEGGVAEARGEPGLVLGDARERRDRGGHEGEADPGTDDEQPEEDVAEVAAADGDLREQERPRAHERHACRGDRPEADLEDRGLSDDRADRDRNREHDRADPELEGRVAEHLLRVEREDERHADRDGADEEHHERWRRRACASGGSAAARAARGGATRSARRQQGARPSRRTGGSSAAAPAGVGRLDDRVDEQDERARDGERPGGVVASPRQRGPALAQEQRATARARPGRGGC